MTICSLSHSMGRKGPDWATRTACFLKSLDDQSLALSLSEPSGYLASMPGLLKTKS